MSQMKEMNEQLTAFRSLLRSQGWDQLAKVLEANIERRQKELENIMLDLDAAMVRNGIIGELRGLKMALNLPAQQVKTIDDYLKTVKEKEDATGK